MYNALAPFIEIAARLIEGYCMLLIFSEFGVHRIKNWLLNGIVTITAWVTISKAISIFAFYDETFSLGNRILSLILRMVAAYLIGVLLYRNRPLIHCFSVWLFTAFTYISIQITQGTGFLLYHITDQLAMRIDVMNNPAFIRFLIDFIKILMEVVSIIISFISAKVIVKNYRYSLSELSAKEIISCIVPTIMGGLASIIIYFVLFSISEKNDIVNYTGVYIFITFAFIAIWLGILYSFKLQQDAMKMREERTQKSILENQVIQMQNSMTEMEVFYKNISRVKHDMKNQMNVMGKMLRQGQPDDSGEINQFFEDLQKTLSELERKIHTGNVVSDAVIGSKFNYAADEIRGIRLNADNFVFTDKIGVKPYDIGIILNNGLDNAIEACLKMRWNNPNAEQYITTKSFWRNKLFFIEIENSFDGVIKWSADGLPCSDKEDTKLHGIGLKNIKHCAEKYSGDMECIVENNKFILSVMLKGNQ